MTIFVRTLSHLYFKNTRPDNHGSLHDCLGVVGEEDGRRQG